MSKTYKKNVSHDTAKIEHQVYQKYVYNVHACTSVYLDTHPVYIRDGAMARLKHSPKTRTTYVTVT